MIQDHFENLAGYPVQDWQSGELFPLDTIVRIGLEYTDYEGGMKWNDKFAEFLAETQELVELPGIVVGPFDFESSQNSASIVNAIARASELFPRLKVLFIGDIISEENEISWIEQSDLSPLLEAYPHLEYLGARGGNNLGLSSPHHENLKSLVIEAGGLDGSVVRSLNTARLPELEHLELYLGTDEYGGNVTLEDLAPLLSGELFPKLRYLGLRDSEMADEIAIVIANAPITKRISVFDLSLGTLGDEGAQALLESESIKRLEKLDLHYHFCTDVMQEKLKALPIEVDVSDAQSGDEWGGEVHRYVSVNE